MIEARGLSYRYERAERRALGPVNLRVGAGEIVLVAGATGSGKTTLLRAVSGASQRQGRGDLRGEVRIVGHDLAGLGADKRARWIGIAGQEPGDRIATTTVFDEVALAPRCLGWPEGRVRDAAALALRRVGLDDTSPDTDPRTLSGGRQQRLVLAAALAGGASALLLDEPLAQLDPKAAAQIGQLLRTLADEGAAIVIAEHRVDLLWPILDRIVLLRDALVQWDGPRPGPEVFSAAGLAPPGAALAASPDPDTAALAEVEWAPARPVGPAIVDARDLSLRWPGVPAAVLSAVTLRIGRGERVAVLGTNGAGKSSLLAAVSGRSRALSPRVVGGSVQRTGRVVEVPQDPDLTLFGDTVRDELRHGALEWGRPTGEAERCAERFGVADLLDRRPHGLSRGQRQRVALAAAAASGPELLVFDEPTAGQDLRATAALATCLRDDGGPALLFATHDLEFALAVATRILIVEGGAVHWDGPSGEVLGAEALRRVGPLPHLLERSSARGAAPQSALAYAIRRGLADRGTPQGGAP